MFLLLAVLIVSCPIHCQEIFQPSSIKNHKNTSNKKQCDYTLGWAPVKYEQNVFNSYYESGVSLQPLKDSCKGFPISLLPGSTIEFLVYYNDGDILKNSEIVISIHLGGDELIEINALDGVTDPQGWKKILVPIDKEGIAYVSFTVIDLEEFIFFDPSFNPTRKNDYFDINYYDSLTTEVELEPTTESGIGTTILTTDIENEITTVSTITEVDLTPTTDIETTVTDIGTETTSVTEPNTTNTETEITELIEYETTTETYEPEPAPDSQLDDYTFWSPVTITMVAVLSFIVVVVIALVSYFLGWRKAVIEEVLDIDIENLPRSITVPRVTRAYTETYSNPYMENP